jgi:sepiapterin reductase
MTTLVIITGASKGIGRNTAIAFAKDQRIQHLGLCLIARNQEGLMQTQALARNSASPGKMILSSTHSVDLSNLDTLEMKIKSVFKEKMRSSDRYERVILINNAGSLGFLGPSSDLPSPNELKESLDFNITSSIWISSYFVRFFGHEHNMKCNVVNMSSLCGVEPFKTMAMYCSGKAAVRMQFLYLFFFNKLSYEAMLQMSHFQFVFLTARYVAQDIGNRRKWRDGEDTELRSWSHRN